MIEYAKTTEKYNKRMFIVSMALIIAMTIIVVSACITIDSLNDNMKRLSVEQWESYMSQDYYYPDITQTQEVEVNK